MFVAALLAAGSVACSSEPSAEPAPSVSPSSSSPAAEAANGELTRKQGAAKYLEIVEPFNKALEKCVPSYNPLLEAGESSPSDFPKIRSACSEMPEANRKFAEELTKVSWPAEAKDSIGQLVDEVRAEQLPWQGMSEVREHSDLFDPEYPLHDDGPAAGMVRAHLGLPANEEIEEQE
ncbi:hypothetical protein AB0D68_10995 [Streptomyces sp. NPDC048212]|uniref:hypothetical protein n=1 Tax=Streptomyces sp. NPDC048212 TaxID=3156658 RepID=UPI0033D8D078